MTLAMSIGGVFFGMWVLAVLTMGVAYGLTSTHSHLH